MTGESLGLDTTSSVGAILLMGYPVPVGGKWERGERPATNARDESTGDVPESACDCVGKKVRSPGRPPGYCILPWNIPSVTKPCVNCQTGPEQVLRDCGAN
jgi:hypothetical protein